MLFGKKTPHNNSTKNSSKHELKITTHSTTPVDLTGSLKLKANQKGYGALEQHLSAFQGALQSNQSHAKKSTAAATNYHLSNKSSTSLQSLINKQNQVPSSFSESQEHLIMKQQNLEFQLRDHEKQTNEALEDLREKTLNIELLFHKFLKLILEKHQSLESQVHDIEQKKVETIQKLFQRIMHIEDKLSLKGQISTNNRSRSQFSEENSERKQKTITNQSSSTYSEGLKLQNISATFLNQLNSVKNSAGHRLSGGASTLGRQSKAQILQEQLSDMKNIQQQKSMKKIKKNSSFLDSQSLQTNRSMKT